MVVTRRRDNKKSVTAEENHDGSRTAKEHRKTDVKRSGNPPDSPSNDASEAQPLKKKSESKLNKSRHQHKRETSLQEDEEQQPVKKRRTRAKSVRERKVESLVEESPPSPKRSSADTESKISEEDPKVLSTESQPVKTARSTKKTTSNNKKKVGTPNEGTSQSKDTNKNSEVDITVAKNSEESDIELDPNALQNKLEQSELELSEYSTDGDNEETDNRTRNKLNMGSNSTPNVDSNPKPKSDLNSNSKKVDPKKDCNKVFVTSPSLQEEPGLSRKSPRARSKVKYIESEAESDSETAPKKRLSLEAKKQEWNLSDSCSEASEPDSESSDSSSSSSASSVKRKQPVHRPAFKKAIGRATASAKDGNYMKDTRRRIDLSEMYDPSGRNSAVEKIKQRQFDGVVRYFLGERASFYIFNVFLFYTQ